MPCFRIPERDLKVVSQQLRRTFFGVVTSVAALFLFGGIEVKKILLTAVIGLLLCLSAFADTMVIDHSRDKALQVVNAYENDDEGAAELSNSLTKLSTPQNLKWADISHGTIQYDKVSPSCGKYEFTLYFNDEQIDQVYWSGLYTESEECFTETVSAFGDFRDCFDTDGYYSFSVRAIGDGILYSDSDLATSEKVYLDCADVKIDTPNIEGINDGIIYITTVSNSAYYIYYYYVGDNYSSDYSLAVAPHYIPEHDIGYDIRDDILDMASWGNDVSNIYICVKAISPDYSQYQNSEMSAPFGPIDGNNISNPEISNGDKLSDILDDINNGYISATDAASEYLDYLQQEGITNTDLAINMESDKAVVDKIKALEDAYLEENDLFVSIDDTSAGTYLTDRGIDVSEVSVVGAGLNSDGMSNVYIEIAEPHEDHFIDSDYFRNTVAVSISMSGVTDSENLDFPVEITMPVPENVNPSFLRILHYHNDGSSEMLVPGIESVDGKYYVRFVLTSFSDFIFCNEVQPAVFTLGNATVNPGGIIKLPIAFENVNVVNSVSLESFNFDSEHFTFLEFEEADDDVLKSALFKNFDNENMEIYIEFENSDVYSFKIGYALFKVDENTPEADYGFSAFGVVNNALETIPAVMQNSIVSVRNYTKGDLNLDNSLDINDAIILFQHSMMPEVYTLDYTGDLDFNKDGFVDINDAILLFQHSMMPEVYPLD